MPLSRSKLSWLLVIVILPVLVLYPFETTVAPSQNILVITEDSHPIKDAIVRQIWQHYSLERDGHEVDFYTNDEGRVSLPKRTVRANFISRVAGPINNIIHAGVHASFGIQTYVM